MKIILPNLKGFTKGVRSKTLIGDKTIAKKLIMLLSCPSKIAILLLLSIYLGWKFETWRPFNLSVISLVALNAVVGLAKLEFGRTKPRLNVDLLYAGGMSYPSGHASNAVLTWGLIAYLYIQYVQPRLEVVRAASISVFVISTIVFWVSIFRNTHWLSDLLGGVAIGTALLLLIIAVDRSIPSRRSNP